MAPTSSPTFSIAWPTPTCGSPKGKAPSCCGATRTDKRLTPLDALKIYALKTAPAFEAALFSGLRLAGPADKYVEPIKQFARNLGVAFQILNDLNDWDGDDHNKLLAGGDVLGGRPTVLWALALEGLNDDRREELRRLVASEPRDRCRRRRACGSSTTRRACSKRPLGWSINTASGPKQSPTRSSRTSSAQLLYYLIDTVLADDHTADGHPAEPAVTIIEPLLPVVAKS